MKNNEYSDLSNLQLSSVENLPNAKSRAIFSVDSSQVFKEDVDMIPVTIDKGVSYMPWGADNLLPYNILDLI